MEERQKAEISRQIKARAESLGFDLCGICRAEVPAGFPSLQSWVKSGYAGEMQYMANRLEAYEHPGSVMQGVLSIVMLGVNYKTSPPGEAADGQGRVSRYAWGESDYHDWIRERLKALKRFVESSVPHAHARGTVDTAPLLERDFGRLAGLGWQAKNTMLIHPQKGSFFFLAALLVNIELEYDTPSETTHCGTCTACLDACPTDAFLEAGALDARKCISYLTIELRGPISHELRPKMGDWVFGCDVCQDVCPWNRKPQPTVEQNFYPSSEKDRIDLAELFEMDDHAFRDRFRGTPMWRSKRGGMLRNAAIVLGNSGDPNSIDILENGLGDPDPLVRGAVVWALGRFRDSEKATRLISMHAGREEEPSVVAELDRIALHSPQSDA